MDIHLKGKVAIVTGGRQGLGHCITDTFLQEGASVVTCARDGQGLEVEVGKWRQLFGERITGLACDVGKAADVERLVRLAQEQYGGLDVLVNNAATSAAGTLATLSDAQWQAEIDVKLMSMVRTARLAVPLMQKRGGGSIININAVFAKQPDLSLVASSVVRASCLSLTKLLAMEFAGERIRANCIGLGVVHTPAWKDWYQPDSGLTYADFLAQCAKMYGVALGRLAEPEEVANVALFLASDAANYITGTQLDVDGGMARYL